MNIFAPTIAANAADNGRGSLRPALATVAVILLLGACATQPGHKPARPSPRSHPAPKAIPHTATTDARGDESGKDAVKPFGKDALAPSEVGYYMDVLQGRLRQAGSSGITRSGDRIAIDLSGRLPFAPGSSQVNAGVRAVLAPLANVLVEYRRTRVSVYFRRDDAGAQANHPRVAELRAQAIARFLIEAGLAGSRISVAGSAAANLQEMQIVIEPAVRSGGGH